MNNIAVVTPVYNTQDYLHRCIDSVLSQKGVSLQHFIIDDGSDDNSPSIAQYYQSIDSRVTYVRKSNEGQGPARNVGIKLADAEYIYFVDSDDHLGEDCLRALYETAKEKRLDICSPAVPKHYFSKPLEYVGCLPCKSQFIRLDLIRKFGVLQPAARSGQDGVFSHLALTHCNRIGMTNRATFHYTHARDGSTFMAHLKRHDLVPLLLQQHYATIEKHYDRHDLWRRNASRLLSFIRDESLSNRVDPHLEHLAAEQAHQCLALLSRVAAKCFALLSNDERERAGRRIQALIDVDPKTLLARYKACVEGPAETITYPKGSNIETAQLVIVKYANDTLSPSSNEQRPATVRSASAARVVDQASSVSQSNTMFRAELAAIRGKLDLALNCLSNATIQTLSSLRSRPRTLENGNPDLVVSLTTLPHRLSLVHYAIESIFAQTQLPSQVVLWVPDSVSGDGVATAELRDLVARGLVVRKVRDVGPHTKLVYALKEFPDKNIVTVDDDIVYPINALQLLWEIHLKFSSAVVCNWARELCFDTTGKVRGVRAGRLLTPPTLEQELEQAEAFETKPSMLAFPYGTSGVLYPPGALHPTVQNVGLMQSLCPKEDDIWFKAMGILNGTPVATTNLGINPSHHCVTGSQFVALRHSNHGLQQNEAQMRAVFDQFDLYSILDRQAQRQEHSSGVIGRPDVSMPQSPQRTQTAKFLHPA